MRNRALLVLGLLIGVGACGGDEREVPAPLASGPDTSAATEIPMSEWDARLAADELERGRMDPAWRRVVQLDSIGPIGAPPSNERFVQISAETVNGGPMYLPLYGDVEGPSVLRLQILLDRALFSPGVIDGHWGKNTEKALYWFQQREGLPRTARLDDSTFARLSEVADGPRELVTRHTLSAEDVEGPFVPIPDDIYEKAELDCLCYESLSEKLAELFHTTPELLEQLNPGTDLDALTEGDTIEVPVIRDPSAAGNVSVAKLVISADGFYVHAVDANGRILFHFPSTLGSSFDPSPSGNHEIAGITHDPWWLYQPSILEHVPDDEEEARIAPGPNNAVGLVWMALSVPHYGIHGTSAPETIGYTTSAGCIRLTNWDALFLADRVSVGTPVEFTRGGSPS